MKRFQAVLLLVAAAQVAHCCVHLMGDSPDSVAPDAGGTHWTYGFRGNDWNGTAKDGSVWGCLSGRKQSPVNIYGLDDKEEAPEEFKTTWSYTPAESNGTNIQVFNNGHTIQVQWAAGTVQSDVSIATAGKTITDVLTMKKGDTVKRVKATPLQFHFHTDSEHTVDGHYYPLELHIVHSVPQSELPDCPATGCLTVTGIMFKVADELDKDNELLKAIWDVMPLREGVSTDLPQGATIDLGALLPEDKDYALYEGSLTTPPCTEGLLWHVLTEPQPISVKQLEKYQTAVGLKECELTKKGNNGNNGNNGRRMLAAASAPEPFVRGSYSGFTHMPATAVQAAGRRLLDDAKDNKEGKPEDYTCKVVSYGFTNRVVQPLNDRSVLHF